RPRFQPKYIPEITYPTPRPHSIQGPRERARAGCSCGMGHSVPHLDRLRTRAYLRAHIPMPLPTLPQLYEISQMREGSLQQVPFAVLMYALAIHEKGVQLELERRQIRKTVVFEAG